MPNSQKYNITENPPVVVIQEPVGYNNSFQVYNQSNQVFANCAEILFINQGTSTVMLNNSIILLPTQAFGGDGKPGETDQTTYIITFTGAGTNSCAVVRKIYV